MTSLVTDSEIRSPFYKKIHEIIHVKNNNIIILIDGPTGVGKSYLALRIAEKVDPTFTRETLKDRLVNKPEKFAELITNENKIHKGNAIILDEAGTAMAASDWQSVNARAMHKIMQVFRYKNLVTIITVPHIGFITKGARHMLDYKISVKKIDRVRNQSQVMMSQPYVNLKGEVKFKRINLYGYVSDIYTFNKPSRKLWFEYERLAKVIKDEILDEELLKMKEQLAMKELKKQQRVLPDFQDIIQTIISNREAYESKHHGKPVIPETTIINSFGVKATHARTIKFKTEEILFGNKKTVIIKKKEEKKPTPGNMFD